MAEAGLFHEKHVELIEGEIFNMAPQRDLHAVTVGLVMAAIQNVFPNDWVRPQLPLSFGMNTDPEPDIAVVSGKPRDYVRLGHHPQTALLVIEVADTSLRYDRQSKCRLYASVGIRDYWIVNLVDSCLEVYRDPAPDASDQTVFTYATKLTLAPDKSLSPLANPTAQIPIADLLP